MDSPNVKLATHLKALGQALGEVIEEKAGERMGFILLAFTFDSDAGRTEYISNCDRGDAIKAMKEFIRIAEADQLGPPSNELS